MSRSPWTPLHARLHQTLRHRRLLQPGQRILVAMSGGQDSLCLGRLLLDLQCQWHWEVAIAHCNHRWRPDADDNAAYVAQLAQTWEVPYYGADLSPAEAAAMTSEAAARTWRYRVLADIAQTHGFEVVVTGHTASDRAETVLYNLVRGSGADGLQALTWGRSLTPTVQLVRPLLNVTRSETGQYCRDAGLQVWEDSTNDDWRYARNRIRQELMPYLQQHFNSAVEQNLAQTAELLQADVTLLESLTDDWWQQAVQMSGLSEPVSQVTPGETQDYWVNRAVLRAAPLALQRRVLRRLLLAILPQAPNFEQIEKLVALLSAPNGSQTDPFPGGAIARVERDQIVFAKPT
ncbi:MAG: tRNA lysidine(34) synthetase TilS [Synechococcales bacterium]|nr:tRNA lysidine(34) synthetase TilS [Synechococcales bacterium]